MTRGPPVTGSRQQSRPGAGKPGVPPRAARRPEPKRRPGKRRKGQRSRKPLLAALAVVLVAGVAVAVVALAGGFGSSSAGPVGPEGVPLESGPALAPAAALPPTQGAGFAVGCGSTEQIATHVHSHLAVYVDGKARSIPLGVGFYGQVQVQSSKHGRFAAGTSNCLYWLHTHAADGIIHVEAPAGRSFVLGQFFGIWGQPLSATQVGGATGRVTAYVDGKRWSGSVDNIPLRSHEDIQLDVGTPLVPPRSVGFPGSL